LRSPSAAIASWGARALSLDDPDGFKLTIFKEQRRRK